MISGDFFSVANNLGDSVAFNLESDTKLEEQFAESTRLENAIRKNLKDIGYGG
jgi:hypothetical protein